VSFTYPNILVLDYLKKTRRVSPEIEMKALEYINAGYQRLLNFEVAGGGFDWYGKPPANIILSGYGLLAMTDMSKVFDIDDRIIDRTRTFILSKQDKKDGSFDLDAGARTSFSWQGLSGKYVVTAYLTWSLLESGLKGKEVESSVMYLKEHLADAGDNGYAVALAANAMAAYNPKDAFTIDLLKKLDDSKKDDAERGSVYWASGGQSVTYATGDYANIETTALVATAMMKTGQFTNTVNKALTHLVKSKDARGTWGSTSATILSLKALVGGMSGAAQTDTVTIVAKVNGQERKIVVTPDQSDVMQLEDFKDVTKIGENTVDITVQGQSAMMYQLVGKYYVPWKDVPEEQKPLDIAVTYDRTRMRMDDVLTAHCRMAYKGTQPTFLIVMDLGVPPGFVPDAEDFIGLVEAKKIERYSMTSKQITIYLGAIQPGQVLEFDYELKAKFPLKAKTPQSVAYEYYTPTNRDVAEPVEIEVTDK
jgi:hypothetical protein